MTNYNLRSKAVGAALMIALGLAAPVPALAEEGLAADGAGTQTTALADAGTTESGTADAGTDGSEASAATAEPQGDAAADASGDAPAEAPSPSADDASATGTDGTETLTQTEQAQAPAVEAPSTVETLAPGWHNTSAGWVYVLADGTKAASCWLNLDAWYHFDANGVAQTGYQVIDGSAYLFDGNARMYAGGWVLYDGSWYFAQRSGDLAKGWLEVGGSWYWLDPATYKMAANEWVDRYWMYSDGSMATSVWLRDADGWHWVGADGKLGEGWVTTYSGMFYFPADYSTHNAALMGTIVVGNTAYHIDENSGLSRNAWVDEADGTRRYAGADGALSMTRLKGDTVYASDGVVAAGWVRVGGSWLYAEPGSGALVRGWRKIDGTWYYLDAQSGTMRTGWSRIDGAWYWLGSDGAMRTGWINDGTGWFYMGGSGAMATGWQLISGIWYYFAPNSGRMQTGLVSDGSTYYWMNSDGSMAGSAGQYGTLLARAQNYGSSTNYLILVDTSANVLGVYRRSGSGWSAMAEWRCSTGASGSPTVKGQFTVGAKGYHFGEDHGYSCYYYTQFHGDYLIHSVKYKAWTFQEDDWRLGMNISGGCVRLPIECAKWIYDNIPVGTKVVTF